MWSRQKYEMVRLELSSLNLQNAGFFREFIDDIITEGNDHIIIDLSKLESIGSIGIGVLFSVLKKTKELGGDLQIIGVNQQTFGLLKVAKLDKITTIHARE